MHISCICAHWRNHEVLKLLGTTWSAVPRNHLDSTDYGVTKKLLGTGPSVPSGGYAPVWPPGTSVPRGHVHNTELHAPVPTSAVPSWRSRAWVRPAACARVIRNVDTFKQAVQYQTCPNQLIFLIFLVPQHGGRDVMWKHPKRVFSMTSLFSRSRARPPCRGTTAACISTVAIGLEGIVGLLVRFLGY